MAARDFRACATPYVQIGTALRTHALTGLFTKRLKRHLQLELLGQYFAEIDVILRKISNVQIFSVFDVHFGIMGVASMAFVLSHRDAWLSFIGSRAVKMANA